MNKSIDTFNAAELIAYDVSIDGCDGGTSESLSVIENGESVYKTSTLVHK